VGILAGAAVVAEGALVDPVEGVHSPVEPTVFEEPEILVVRGLH
jgi:hypothetical protein